MSASLLESLVPALKAYVDKKMGAAIDRIDARLAQIPRYEGVWLAEQTYAKGAMVSLSGSVWHCHADASCERPGTGSDWQLAVKRGKDGRDLLKGDF